MNTKETYKLQTLEFFNQPPICTCAEQTVLSARNRHFFNFVTLIVTSYLKTRHQENFIASF